MTDENVTNSDLPDGVTFETLPDEIVSNEVTQCPVPSCDHVSAGVVRHIAHKHPTVRDAYTAVRRRVYTYVGDEEDEHPPRHA